MRAVWCHAVRCVTGFDVPVSVSNRAQQVRPSTRKTLTVETLVAQRYPDLALDVDAIYAVNVSTLEAELQQATVHRAAFSERQLYQRMVEFWSDHFNIDFGKVGYLKLIDDRDVIRKHALGRFG